MGPQEPEVAMLAKRVVEALTPELRSLADDVGVSYASVKYWKTGERTPAPENLSKLADIAEGRAEELLALTARLRRVAERRKG